MSDSMARAAMDLLLPVLTGSVRSSVEGLLAEAEARGVAAERARVVAWLRCENRAAPVKGREFNSMCRLADAIERGEHEEGA